MGKHWVPDQENPGSNLGHGGLSVMVNSRCECEVLMYILARNKNRLRNKM